MDLQYQRPFANIGVSLAGLLVAWLGHAWPDLMVVGGLAIALFAAKGGFDILLDARRTARADAD